MKNDSVIELSEGPILRKILVFAIPFLVSSLLMQLFSLTDFYFIGNHIGARGTAAVSSSLNVMTCMIGLVTGIAAGTGSIAGREWGAKKVDYVVYVGKTARKIGGLMGLFFVGINVLFLKTIFLWMQIPDSIVSMAFQYTMIYIVGLIPMIQIQILYVLLRSVGKGRITIYVMIFSGLLNVALDYLMIVRLESGVQGAAVATVISQVMAYFIIHWIYDREFPENKNKLYINVEQKKILLLDLIRVGIPSGIQAVLLTLSNLLMQSYINQLGESQMAAFALYFKVENFLYLPILAIGQAMMIYTAQNLGAGRWDRIKRGIRQGALFTMPMTVFVGWITLFYDDEILSFFLKEEEVIMIASGMMAISFPFYFLYAVIEIMGAALRGLGDGARPMINSIIGLGILRILMVGSIGEIYSFKQLIRIYPITWCVTAILNRISFHMKWKERKEG